MNIEEYRRQQSERILACYMDSSNTFSKSEDNNLEKGGGEGSRGGKVIGHTKSGKPIYDSHGHEAHQKFTKQDHKDARNSYEKVVNNYKSFDKNGDIQLTPEEEHTVKQYYRHHSSAFHGKDSNLSSKDDDSNLGFFKYTRSRDEKERRIKQEKNKKGLEVNSSKKTDKEHNEHIQDHISHAHENGVTKKNIDNIYQAMKNSGRLDEGHDEEDVKSNLTKDIKDMRRLGFRDSHSPHELRTNYVGQGKP